MAKTTDTKRFFVNAYGIGTTLTPLVHTEASVGNKTFVRRLSIKAGDQIVSTPALSGNSFRGMWRDLMAIDLMQRLQVKELFGGLFGVFFSGGLLTKEAKKGLGDKLYATFPTLRLLGFSFGNIMFPSKVGADFAVPITTETTAYAQAAYPNLKCPPPTQEASEITAMTMLTAKKDDEKAALIELHIAETAERSGQMIYHVEYIVPNINFVHGFRSLYPLSDLEFGALLKVLSLSSGRSFGGLGSKGFGRMNWTYTLEVADAPNTKGKTHTVQLGNKLEIDRALQPMLDAYDEYVGTLPDIIKKDTDLKTMIK